MSFKRGFSISSNEKILIVEDVITTSGSIKEIIDLLKKDILISLELPVLLLVKVTVNLYPFKILSLLEIYF